jgi:glucan phosphoethanolaminetransferase (alkaline phosphatase superfamily)
LSLGGLGLLVIFAAAWLALMKVFLQTGKKWPMASTFVLGLAWILYSPSIITWIGHLGSDSFSEAQNFDLGEALNLLQSLKQVVHREGLGDTGLTIALGIMLAAAILAVGPFIRRRLGGTGMTPVIAPACALILITIVLQIFPAFSAFQLNSKVYQATYDNFHEHHAATAENLVVYGETVNDLNVVVYIGESTTSMNMSIYGYPRLTTPELAKFQSENDGMLVFYNVFSTHTHTAPSLLEALSVGLDAKEDILPIKKRRRMSVVDLLNHAGIPSTLISNQGSAGVWNNLASTIVFQNVRDKEFSIKSVYLGDLDHRAGHPFDKEFLGTALERRGLLSRNGPKVIFLHSYAGHGPYLRNVPAAFKRPVDEFLMSRSAASIVGDGVSDPSGVVRNIDHYDSTVRYIDHSVASIMRSVKTSPLPSVFVYFSDHGEAVYAGRGHDSSRFLHEMARVPFIVYFNEAAAHRYPDILKRFHRASGRRRVSSLAQLPATLLSLFGLGMHNALGGVDMDEAEVLPPILTRKTGSGHSHFLLGQPNHFWWEPDLSSDVTDSDTDLFLTSQRPELENTMLCQHESNSVGKALRGALVADCLWLDLHLPEDGVPAPVPMTQSSGFVDLAAISAIAQGYGRSLWIVAKHPDSMLSCLAVDASFESQTTARRLNPLVMFPATASWRESDLRTCMDSLRAKGLRTGFEVPSVLATRCAVDLNQSVVESTNCAELSQILQEVVDSKSFSDLGFDISFAKMMRSFGIARKLAWNTWSVKLHDLESIQPSRYRMIAVDSDQDPNSISHPLRSR